MPKIDVYNTQREKVSTIDLDDAVFGGEVREHLLYAVVRYQLAKKRQGTHKVKGRAEISGGGKKPWKQKGTGRARQGTIRAPQWRGGGIVHGPTPRSHAFKLNKKVRSAALCSALSRRLEENALIVLDKIELEAIKTKAIAEILERFELSDALVVLPKEDEMVAKAARNLPGVTVLPSEGLNVYDVLLRRNLVLTADAVEAVTKRLQARSAGTADLGGA